METEALPSNPKIERTTDGKYMFKPPYKLKDRKALLKLLKQQDLKGLGGIMLDDIQESLPNCEKALKVKINCKTFPYMYLQQKNIYINIYNYCPTAFAK